jgi:hypothetical protein
MVLSSRLITVGGDAKFGESDAVLPLPLCAKVKKKTYAEAMVTPPSITMVCPVMKLEASEPR